MKNFKRIEEIMNDMRDKEKEIVDFAFDIFNDFDESEIKSQPKSIQFLYQAVKEYKDLLSELEGIEND
jgi:hypothetical protein